MHVKYGLSSFPETAGKTRYISHYPSIYIVLWQKSTPQSNTFLQSLLRIDPRPGALEYCKSTFWCIKGKSRCVGGGRTTTAPPCMIPEPAQRSQSLCFHRHAIFFIKECEHPVNQDFVKHFVILMRMCEIVNGLGE